MMSAIQQQKTDFIDMQRNTGICKTKYNTCMQIGNLVCKGVCRGIHHIRSMQRCPPCRVQYAERMRRHPPSRQLSMQKKYAEASTYVGNLARRGILRYAETSLDYHVHVIVKKGLKAKQYAEDYRNILKHRYVGNRVCREILRYAEVSACNQHKVPKSNLTTTCLSTIKNILH